MNSKSSKGRRGIVRIATALILSPLALTAAGILASPQEMSEWVGDGTSSAESLLILNSQLRHGLELSIVLFQILAAASLCLWRLLPEGAWTSSGRKGFVIAILGLGLGGTLSAGYGSPFALIAGGSMAFLLVLNVLGTGPPAVNPFRPARVPAIMSR